VLQYEREQPQCLVKSLSRRRRIARGSGRTEVDVSNMLASFANMQSKVRDLSKLMKMSGANGALTIGSLAVVVLQPGHPDQMVCREVTRSGDGGSTGGVACARRDWGQASGEWLSFWMHGVCAS
jgi:hypothetical protein